MKENIFPTTLSLHEEELDNFVIFEWILDKLFFNFELNWPKILQS